jgi:type II secretory pathway pseudopilin PulG
MLKTETLYRNKGFTLIEALITLVISIIVITGALHLWQFASARTLNILGSSDAFENARVAMDAILINIQLADEITLKTDADGTLKTLELVELDPDWKKKAYVFRYYGDAYPGDTMYQRLNFGDGGNEFASRIAGLSIVKSGSLLIIKLTTDDEAVHTLECSASIRNKIFN